jgi:large subunit ribosomal protein L47
LELTTIVKENNSDYKVGRSWKAGELRLKSDSDLHKLWYVLLKEKLALKSEIYKFSQKFDINLSLTKREKNVKVSMSRLKSVVWERNTLRNEFMMFLEFYYIRKKQMNGEYNLSSQKKESANKDKSSLDSSPFSTVEQFTQQKQEVEHKKTKTVKIRGALGPTKEEITQESVTDDIKILDTKDEKIIKVVSDNKIEIYEEINADANFNVNVNANANASNTGSTDKDISVLNETELNIVQKLKKSYKSRNEFLDDYITNRKLLRPNEKRRIAGIINASRAHHAKNIFMKEMAALSYKLKNSYSSKNPIISRLENL